MTHDVALEDLLLVLPLEVDIVVLGCLNEHTHLLYSKSALSLSLSLQKVKKIPSNLLLPLRSVQHVSLSVREGERPEELYSIQDQEVIAN